jgi:hypothetical protein
MITNQQNQKKKKKKKKKKQLFTRRNDFGFILEIRNLTLTFQYPKYPLGFFWILSKLGCGFNF